MGRVAAIAAAAAVGPAAHAAEWRVAPSVGATIVNESNPSLVAESSEDQRAFATDLNLSLERQTETVSIAFTSSVARRQYREDESLNRSDLNATASLQHAATERFLWSASSTAARDTTLTSELGTSGETRVGYRHESLGAQLQAQWRPTELWSTTMSMQWQGDYYPSEGSGLVDYGYLAASFVNTWRRSSQDSLGIVLHAGRLGISRAPTDIKDTSAALQYTRTIDERWSLIAVAGPAWASGSGGTQRGETYKFDLSRAAQYWAVSLALDRAIAPTGRGYLTSRDSMSLQLRRDLSAQLSGSLAARYLRSRNIVGAQDFVFDDVRYRRIEAGLSWSFAPQWSTNLHAGYADQEQSASGVRVSGVDLGVGIRWSGKNHVF
jgi:hypothetical protein